MLNKKESEYSGLRLVFQEFGDVTQETAEKTDLFSFLASAPDGGESGETNGGII